MRTGTIAAAVGLLSLTSAAFAAPAQVTLTGFGPASASSWLAGALVGYNWQRGPVVFGFEGDLSGLDLKSETAGGFSSPLTNFVYPSGDAVARIDWYGTVRARLGWASGPFLFYGTGGLAYGHASLSNTYNLGTFGQTFSIAPLSAQISPVRGGWVAGGGIEYLLTRNLSLGVEYQYVQLGSLNLGALSAPPPIQRLTGSSASAQAQLQAVTLSVSWHFPPPDSALASMPTHRGAAVVPPPANPWEGLYVGGRAGGAWGDRLNVTAPPRFLPPA